MFFLLLILGKTAHETKDFFGKIIIKHKQGKSEIEIPYWATVFQGGLFYNASVTKYLTDKGSGDNGSRNFTVVNKYEYPLAITNISLPIEAQLYFSVRFFYSIKNKTKTMLCACPQLVALLITSTCLCFR